MDFAGNSCRKPVQFTSPPYTPPPLIQSSHSSPDNLQRNAAVSPTVLAEECQNRSYSVFFPFISRWIWCGSSTHSRSSSWTAASLISRGSRQVENLSEQAPGSTITPPTSTQHPRRTAPAGISTTMMDQVPAVIRSTAGQAITSIKTGTPIATTTAEAAVDITTTGATAAASKTIGGDDTETPHRFQKRLLVFQTLLRLFVQEQTTLDVE